MTSIAAGIASATSSTVFTYSIANFPTFRCLEQIRNDVVHQRNSVVAVALGAGFSYGTLGYTHFGIEDIAIIRALGEISIYSPCDDVETKALTQFLIENPTPAYLRLGRHLPLEMTENVPPRQGKFRTLSSGDDVAIICTGAIVHEVIQARKELLALGVYARVISCHSIRPMDVQALRDLADDGMRVVTVEEHRTSGGLGTEVLETCAREAIRLDVLNLGISYLDLTEAGSRSFLLRKHGLDSSGIADRTQAWLRESN